MKILLIILLSLALTLFGDTHEVLISGLSYHPEKSEKLDYNEVNYGLGYRYRVQTNNYETYIATMAIKDSHSHFMAMGTVGAMLYLFKNDYYNLRIGVEGGLAYRKLLDYKNEYGIETFDYHYSVIPILAPVMAVNIHDVGINFNYVPKLEIGDVTINEVYYLYFSVAF